jgi:hypothetical protein
MNLQKLLAENMVRFGVKNLNAQSHKTLLNEGVKPGGVVEDQPNLVLNYIGGAETAITRALAKVSKPNYNAAILAVGAGFANIAAKTKGLRYDQKSKLNGQHEGIIGFLTGTQSPSENFAYNDKKLEEKAVEALIQSCNFTYKRDDVSVYPGPRGGVATLGRVEYSRGFTVNDQGRQKGSNYDNLISYLNRFNIGNVITGDFTQYNLSSMLDSNNYVDLLNAQVATNAIYVYTKSTYAPGVANKEISTTTQGATAPIDKNYDVSFEQGKFEVPTNDSEVARAVADAIAMFPDGNISNLSIVSSASPEYGVITNVPGWEKSYPKGITGTGNPGNGTDDASRNIKLAYDRGVNFVAAINAGLAAQGKSEIQGYNINWQISDKDGTKVPGRYAKVLWSKAGTPGKDVTDLDNTGKAGTNTYGKETYTIYQHVFTPVS